jgi:hypothetical protein
MAKRVLRKLGATAKWGWFGVKKNVLLPIQLSFSQ